MLFAGFLCQPFSGAGLGHGFDHVRGSIIFHSIKFMTITKPRAARLEHVGNFSEHDSGTTLTRVVDAMGGIGYLVNWKKCEPILESG